MSNTASLSAALSHRMNHLIARQGVVSGNIANADTPNYLSKDIQFAPLAAKSAKSVGLARTNARHFSGDSKTGGAGKLMEDRSNMRYDGNSVKLDQEMLKLNEIQLNNRLVNQIYAKQVQFQKMSLGNR